MTMLDEDVLTSLFARAATSFEVPESGPDDILARAFGPAGAGEPPEQGAADLEAAEDAPDEPADVAGDELSARRSRRLVATARRHRILSVAAGVVAVLLVAGTIGAVVRSTSPSPTLNSSLPTAHASVHGRAPANPSTGAAGSAAGPALAPAFSAQGGVSAGKAQSTNGAPAQTVPSTTAPPSLPSGAVGRPAKIEQTGTLGLTVGHNDVDRTMTRLSALAVAYGGFVANSQTQSGSGGSPYGNVTLQVPVDSFSTVLKQAQAFGKTSDLSTKATDVTSQYVDLQARLSALQDTRQQYLTILSKATSIGDVLSVQEQIDAIQQQIEQLQGQLNVLNSETQYSTLTVNVNQAAAPPRPVPLPESGFVHAWHDSVGGFVAGVEGIVRIAGPVLFALLILGIVLVGGRVLWRRYQRHRL